LGPEIRSVYSKSGAPSAAIVGVEMTAMENAGRDAVDDPRPTEITIPEYVRISAVEGVPVRAPLLGLNSVHGGWFWIENFTERPDVLTVGRKL